MFTLFYGKVINYSNESLCNLLVLLITKRYLFGMNSIYFGIGGVFVLCQQIRSQQRWSILSIGDSYMKRQFLKYALAASAAAVLAACGGGSDPVVPPGNGVVPPPPSQNIVQLAQATPELSILVEAVVAADLAGALSAPGPLTVFAPNNAAFAALLTELKTDKATLLANKPLLTKVLTYHVLTSKVLKADVPVGVPITTLQGGKFTVDATLAITDESTPPRKANIIATDILATNGVVHLIDKVILPK
jgi:Fasciclin domain/TAT (twin-arginine translocation) pathway signal sequence